MAIGRLLIVKGETNKHVIHEDKTGAQGLLQENHPLLCIPLSHIVKETIAYKAQWLENLAAAKLKYQKKQEAGKRHHQKPHFCFVFYINTDEMQK